MCVCVCVEPAKETDRQGLCTCIVLAVLHIALPECFWCGNLLTEVVWHYSWILYTYTPDVPLLMTTTTTHRTLPSHTQSQTGWRFSLRKLPPILFLWNVVKVSGKSQLCVTDLLPVTGLPLGAGLQCTWLCAVWPQHGVTAMRRGAVHQSLPHTFTTTARALKEAIYERCLHFSQWNPFCISRISKMWQFLYMFFVWWCSRGTVVP